jgi:hypothetical protein
MAKKILKKVQDGDAVRKYQKEQALIAYAKAMRNDRRNFNIQAMQSSLPSRADRPARLDSQSKKSQLANLDLLEKMYAPKKKMGGMIKRADGSYSKRGLWDNIRAKKGSGKKPTSEMLKQEKKIKAQTKKK